MTLKINLYFQPKNIITKYKCKRDSSLIEDMTNLNYNKFRYIAGIYFVIKTEEWYLQVVEDNRRIYV